MTQKREKNLIANKIIARIRLPLGNSLRKGVWAEFPVLLGCTAYFSGKAKLLIQMLCGHKSDGILHRVVLRITVTFL